MALDQRRLPRETRILAIATVDDLVDAIQSLAIRGAPALGVAGAFGVVLAMSAHSDGTYVDYDAVHRDAQRIESVRPTAVNLRRGVQHVLAAVPHGREAALREALAIVEEGIRSNRAAAENAAALVVDLCADRQLRILTHCNTGRLATGTVGTALGAIEVLASQGRIERVLVDETRPLLQGARLTCWELNRAGIAHELTVDSAAAWAMAQGRVDCVLVGADRIAANGDVANKIGTYGLALAASRHGVPFVVVAPESTRDPDTRTGADIVVEQRGAVEVLAWMGEPVATSATEVFNPAFDVTPASLVTAVVTERAARPARSGLAEAVLARTVVHADYRRPEVGFRDLSGLYADPSVFDDVVAAVVQEIPHDVDRVVAVDARGFVLGTALSVRLRAPLVLARKPGKLPGPTRHAIYDLEYRSSALQTQVGAIGRGERMLVVDDVLATGGTLAAAVELVRAAGASVVALAVALTLTGLGGRERLAGHRLVSVAEVAP